jgi:hypothetical protein
VSARYTMRATRLEHDLTGVYSAPQDGAPRGALLFLHGMMAGAWQFEQLQPFFASCSSCARVATTRS